VVKAESVQLASCPKEGDDTSGGVIGKFYNNGEVCVRDRIVLERQVEKADCPSEYNYVNGWCRRRFHRKLKPTCASKPALFLDDADTDNDNGTPVSKKNKKNNNSKKWQLFLGAKGECHSPCPKNYAASYGKCILQRQTLSQKYMTCPMIDNGDGVLETHRNGPYCCSHELGNCPRPVCKVGDHVPGKFYYDVETNTCTRQAEAIKRGVLPRLPITQQADIAKNGLRNKGNTSPNKNSGVCPKGLVPVRGNSCQEPCPEGFVTMKGKCDLKACTFHTQTDLIVRCPEGIYALPRAEV